MHDDRTGDDDARLGLRLEGVDLVDAIMRNDLVAAQMYAQLLAINAESQGLTEIGQAARDVLDRLVASEVIPLEGVGAALTRLITLVNPPIAR